MKLLTLSNSERKAMLDDNQYQRAATYSQWHLTKQNYVRSNKGGGVPHSTKQIFLHELILGPCPGGMECDHRDLDRSNYQRENLRYVPRSNNQRHKRMQRNNTSGYRGVVRVNIRGWGAWCARIKIDGKQKSLGYFQDPIMAARAYDAAARQYHGEFATLNFKEN